MESVILASGVGALCAALMLYQIHRDFKSRHESQSRHDRGSDNDNRDK